MDTPKLLPSSILGISSCTHILTCGGKKTRHGKKKTRAVSAPATSHHNFDTYRVTFLYERPDLWFDLFNKFNEVSVALHHPTRHDKDLGASHCWIATIGHEFQWRLEVMHHRRMLWHLPLSSSPPSSSFLFLAFCCKNKSRGRYSNAAHGRLVINLRCTFTAQVGSLQLLVHRAGLTAGWGLAPSDWSLSEYLSAQRYLWLDPGLKHMIHFTFGIYQHCVVQQWYTCQINTAPLILKWYKTKTQDIKN